MEITSRPLERDNPSPINSPRPVSRSEPSSYPTTFVQADPNSFKKVVQMLTGSPSETTTTAAAAKQSAPNKSPNSDLRNHIPPIKTQKKQQGFKLYERRNQLKNGFMISPLVPGGFDRSSGCLPAEYLSPSILDFPSLVLSPVTPLIEDPFDKSSASSSEEEKAIAEKGFYLHPSPRTAATGDSEPRLLPLFPVSSPRVSDESS